MKRHRSVQDLLSDLTSCSLRRDRQWGKRIHASAIGSCIASNKYVLTALIKMYAKCGSMVDASRVFDGIQQPNVVSWTALLFGHAENGEEHAVLGLFSRMKACGCSPNAVTYAAVLKACKSLAEASGDKGVWLEKTSEVHSEIGSQADRFLQSMLVEMYAKCRSMSHARRVFDGIQNPDVVSWSALIFGYADNGEGRAALDMFSRMKHSGCAPDSVACLAALKACTSLAVSGTVCEKAEALQQGREIHSAMACKLSLSVQNTLVDMYAKCRSIRDARRVFDSIETPDVVSWNALLLGYAENGEGLSALDLFERMKTTRGCAPDSITYIAALKACISLAESTEKRFCLERGRQIHTEIGRSASTYVQNTLISMYASCGSMVEAHQVFDSMPATDVVSWSALLSGYAENGKGLVALYLFSRMKAGGCTPDALAYVAAVKACTSLVPNAGKPDCLQRGREIHLEIGCKLNHYLQNALIDLYSKCGSIADARLVFDGMEKPDVICWNSLVLGYADNGEAHIALSLFSRMKDSGCAPNPVSYVAAFKACGLIGDVALGRKLHSEIRDFDGHLVACLVDFYAKCGSMAEAREVFESHTDARDVPTWNALLAGYCSFGDSDSVFDVSEAMQDEGVQPNGVTFLCLLLCCSHAGLVLKARTYFEAMRVQHRVTPTVMHYTCMVDVLGRANQLNEAVELIRRMPLNPHSVTWRTLLGACRKWKNAEVGKLAFRSLAETNASAFVLLSHAYDDKRGLVANQQAVKPASLV